VLKEALGLGLAIAKQIAVMKCGDIDVESEVGKGTYFYISLPLYKSVH